MNAVIARTSFSGIAGIVCPVAATIVSLASSSASPRGYQDPKRRCTMLSLRRCLALFPAFLLLFGYTPPGDATPPRSNLELSRDFASPPVDTKRVSPKPNVPQRGNVSGHAPVLVYGYVTYPYFGFDLPARNARVEIWDSDGGNILNPDDFLGATETDSDGRYSLMVYNTEDSGVDLFIRVFTYNSATYVTPYVWGPPERSFGVQSPTLLVDWIDTTARIDLRVPAEDRASFRVFDVCVEAWTQVEYLFGLRLPRLPVEYPAFVPTLYDPTTGWMHVNTADAWAERIVFHEYGHFVGDERGFANGGFRANHGPCTDWRDPAWPWDSPGAGAIQEGWADFFALVIGRMSKQTPHCDGCEGSVCEDYWCDDYEEFDLLRECDFETHDGHGEFFEASITATLWDLYDPHLTDQCCDPIEDSITENVQRPIQEIFATFDDNEVKTMAEFYHQYMRTRRGSEHQEFRRQVTDVFLDNGMGFLAQRPHNPIPPDRETNVSRAAQLHWVSENGDRFDLLFSPDPQVDRNDFIGNTIVDATTWVPNELAACTDYFWQVVGGNALGMDSWGPVWQFRTGPETVRVSGRVTTPLGTPLTSVTIRLTGQSGATTDATGSFAKELDCRWSGTVTPEKPGWSFVPASRSFSEIVSDQRADFVGVVTPTARIDAEHSWGYQPVSVGSGCAFAARAAGLNYPPQNVRLSWSLIPIGGDTPGGLVISGCRPGDDVCVFRSEPVSPTAPFAGGGYGLYLTVTEPNTGVSSVIERELCLALPGDVNNDLVVDAADRAILNDYLRNGPNAFDNRDCDVNCDGVVDDSDLQWIEDIWRGVPLVPRSTDEGCRY